MSTQWFPVVTLVLGSVLALVSGLLVQSIKARQDRLAARDQQEAESSRASLDELRKLLADLQDASEQFVDSIYGAAEAMDAQYEQRAAMEEKLRAAYLHLTLIASRLPDRGWLRLAKELLSTDAKLHDAKSAQERRTVMELAWDTCSALLVATGKPFQEYYRQGLTSIQQPAAGKRDRPSGRRTVTHQDKAPPDPSPADESGEPDLPRPVEVTERA